MAELSYLRRCYADRRAMEPPLTTISPYYSRPKNDINKNNNNGKKCRCGCDHGENFMKEINVYCMMSLQSLIVSQKDCVLFLCHEDV